MALKLLYGAAFAIVLPVLLILWAMATQGAVPLRADFPLPLGILATAAGIALMLAGMAALRVYGQGLPMNAFPPPKYVTRGIYRYVAHPIYLGFSMAVAGVAMAAKSASGAWLVTPVVMMGCAALVLGYERQDLRSRFGPDLPKPLFHLPTDEPAPLTVAERFSCYVLVLIPWLILYEGVSALGVPPDARSAFLDFEHRLPVLPWTEPVYASTYLFVCAAPVLAKTQRDLRRFAVGGLLAMALVFPLFLALPLIAPPRPFTPHGALGTLLVWERTFDTPAEAFPSFHVIWALLAAEVFAGRMPRMRWLWRGWGLAIAVSCITTGAHALADVVGGFVVTALVMRAGAVWECVRRFAERIANSWREWQLGGVRVINHGLYAGLAGFTAIFIPAVLAGPGHQAAVFVTGSSALVMAGLWAQYIEGSPRLLRPYGFYGGVLGAVIGALLGPLLGAGVWLLLAAFSVAGPWIQSFGRLRCLVQGCCHGHPAPKEVGIRYMRPRSRVCRLTGWKGLPLHPTQVYSILWNIFVALAMARLWSLHARLSLIAGLYLVLTGLGRFVEEAYRGEPQTAIIARLRLYQWIAAATVITGALVTTVDTGAAPATEFSWAPLLPAAVFGLICAFALGVDFPRSNRRFARLA